MGRADLEVGSLVSVTPPDRSEHSRTPGYVGDRLGRVSRSHGRHLLPASVVRAAPVAEEVWSVAFSAAEIFGVGDHHVHVDLYESALEAHRD